MLAVKPLSAFTVLDKYLSPAAVKLTLSPHDKLPLTADSPQVTLLRQGIIKVERSQEDILVAISPSPTILGLAGVHIASSENYMLTALTSCEIFQLELAQCQELLDKHQLWREGFQWVSWLCRVQEQRDIQLIGKSSYSQIRATLQSMAGWEQSLLARIGVMNYIQQRTHISRSVIAEVLAALRAGNYIEMDKGKLIAINRLPLEY